MARLGRREPFPWKFLKPPVIGASQVTEGDIIQARSRPLRIEAQRHKLIIQGRSRPTILVADPK